MNISCQHCGKELENYENYIPVLMITPGDPVEEKWCIHCVRGIKYIEPKESDLSDSMKDTITKLRDRKGEAISYD